MKKLAWLIILVSLGSLFFSCEESGEDGPGCTITNPQSGDKIFRGDRIRIKVEAGISTYDVSYYIDDSVICVSGMNNIGNTWYYDWTPKYAGVGNHTLKVEAATNKRIKSSDEIIIELADYEPVASFSSNHILINSASEIQFVDLSSNHPTSWQWDFGDGETSHEKNPVHTYKSEGVYTVSLTVTNNTGMNKLTRESYITVTNDNTIKDIDNNVYNTVTIGTQVWMKENLKTTTLKNGTSIPIVVNDEEWYNLSSSGCCFQWNDSLEYKNIYGTLYNWYVIETEKLCPEGWHVPTDDDWNILFDHLGGRDIAGGKMKRAGTEYWDDPNTGATNESGFDAIPGGIKIVDNGNGIGTMASFWSGSGDTNRQRVITLWSGYQKVIPDGGDYYKNSGNSVRCIKD